MEDDGSECAHEPEVLLCCANSWCHEKSPSAPFTAPPAAGTILATVLSPTAPTVHSVNMFKPVAHGELALCLPVEESPVSVQHVQCPVYKIVENVLETGSVRFHRIMKGFAEEVSAGAVTITGGQS